MAYEIKRAAIDQKIMARQAITLLECIGELFFDGDINDYVEWSDKVKEFDQWIWDSSPLA